MKSIHAKTGVVGNRRQPRRLGSGPGLEQRIAGEGGLSFRHVRGLRRQGEEFDIDALGLKDAHDLLDLVVVAGREDGPNGHDASAARCNAVSSTQPAAARSRSWSRRRRSKGSPSAVPWTST